MINYSIVMRSVNANLFDINQAKSRINKAKENGETPSPEDVALVATERQNAFAIAQYADVMTIEKFAKHIATHGCVYSRADISAILYMAVDCMREQLLEGKKIRLGDLGDFSVSPQSSLCSVAGSLHFGRHFGAAFVTADVGGIVLGGPYHRTAGYETGDDVGMSPFATVVVVAAADDIAEIWVGGDAERAGDMTAIHAVKRLVDVERLLATVEDNIAIDAIGHWFAVVPRDKAPRTMEIGGSDF